MLLECKHCGAPLDVRGDERLTQCKYCGTISRAKALRTVANETPPDFRPPQQWTPPAHAHADPTKVFTYHASWAIGRLVRVAVSFVVLLTLLPLIIPLVIGFIATAVTATGDVQETINAAQGALAIAQEQIQTARGQFANAKSAGPNLLTNDGAAGLAEHYRKRLGQNIKALRLTIHPGHASLEAQDPAKPSHVDRYDFRNGVVGDAQPVNVQHLGKRLTGQLFALDDVALDKMSTLAETTLTELDSEGATVTHAIVQRSSNGKVAIRVYASGPRRSGSVEFTASGTKMRVFR